METNQRLQVTFEKLVYGGAALARPNGQVLLAPFALPGETAEVEVRNARSDLLEAWVTEILTPSAVRTQPPCPYFGVCGGCAYQHAPYEYQLEQKRAILVEAFTRLGKLPAPEVTVVSGPEWHYRNRTQLHIRNGRIGYLRAGSHDLCPIDRCPISSPSINAAIAALSEMVGDRRFPRFVRSIELFTNESALQLNVLDTGRPVSRHFFEWCSERIPGLVSGAIEYPAAGFTFRVGYRSFFQVNRFLVDRLVDAALGGAQGPRALDLYAGVGLFSLPLARKFDHVTAIESGLSAHRDLEFNAARAGIPLDATREDAARYLSGVTEAPDLVLADPPRAGLGKEVVAQLIRIAPARLTIVACDPATLVRDLARLAAGGFAIAGVQLLDLFPQTYHMETVVHLTR
jgi:23S rRNA (uracil1939-C5)-methyltransferase